MANETTLTITGNLTDEPTLRFTQSGAPVANFTIASTPRTFDKNTGGWSDGDPLFLRCTAWRDLAEHIAESLPKGARVIASGRLSQRSYTTESGEKRTVIELTVDDIGPSLMWATAEVRKAKRTDGKPKPRTAASESDPWETTPAADRPPF